MAKSHVVGTSIALTPAAMRLNEAITIYLAIGAPFGVRNFLHAQVHQLGFRKVLKAVLAGMSWPLVVWRMMVTHFTQSSPAAITDRGAIGHEEHINDAQRRLVSSIQSLIELTASARGSAHDDMERASYVLRENVDTYVGLAPAVNDAAVNDSSNEHAHELFRIAGLKGDDILLATRCANRRNASRIAEHFSRARNLIVHSIADLSEAVERVRPQIVANGVSERRLRMAAVELYKNTFDLLSLMDDEDSAMRIAELLNRELSRQRRLEFMETRTVLTDDTGEELCRTHSLHPSPALSSKESTPAQG